MTKHLTTIAAAIVAVALPCYADQPDADTKEKTERHLQGSVELADEQDELSADAQQLALEQTVEKVIKLLEEVEEAMDDASYRLEDHDTGGETIAGFRNLTTAYARISGLLISTPMDRHLVTDRHSANRFDDAKAHIGAR